MEQIAAVIPTFNEERAIKEVIENIPDTARGLEIETFVIDGGSTDNTCKKVNETDAELIQQSYDGGKGSAMREVLDLIEADIYVFLDGDMTYPGGEINKLVEPIIESGYDHVAGSRIKERHRDAFEHSHLVANLLYSSLTRKLFNSDITDVVTGYRAMTSEHVEHLELESEGFEIETEIVFKTLHLGEKFKEVDIEYRPRIGESKLGKFTDGFRILGYAAILYAGLKTGRIPR